jgi:hypothetical protein
VDATHPTCCETLAYYLERECPTHPDPWDCPDRLFYRATDGEIGIVIHDGGSSFVTMLYCPFCSSALPLSASRSENGPTGGDPLRRIDLEWPGEQ